jgi:leader peptidase (prepilin peptidase) / N-methyltransferase
MQEGRLQPPLPHVWIWFPVPRVGVAVQALFALLAGLLGLVLGSFANVPIVRWPQGGSVAEPKRSACPACGMLIAPRDNIPVVSWLLLGRKCRNCEAPISARYAVVELTTGIVFGVVAWVWGLDPLLPALLVFAWSLVVATAIDLEHRIIPNRLTYRLPFVLLPLLVFAAWMDGNWLDLRRGVIAGVAIPLVMFLLSEVFRLLRGQSGMGMGDVKLAVSIGLVVGYLGGMELVVFAYSSVIAAVVIAFALILTGRAKLASRIPFGPYLAVGAMLPILAGPATTSFVRGFLGL